jgi:hypothetical protein
VKVLVSPIQNKQNRLLHLIKLLFVSALLCLSTSIYTQYFKGGLTFGLTGSQMDGDNLSGYNKLGISTGMFVRRDFSERTAMMGEIKFIMKGAAKKISLSSQTTYKMTLYYFELPLTILYRTSKKVEVETGLAAAYFAAAPADYGYNPENASGLFKITDWSYLAGVYYNYSERLNFNLKFSYSIRPVSNFPGNQTFWGTYGQYNHLLDMAVYYTLK